jgi:hypothetical protein
LYLNVDKIINGATEWVWQDGKRMTWDFTVPDILAPFYIHSISGPACAGAAAEAVDVRKQNKYAALIQRIQGDYLNTRYKSCCCREYL